MKFLFRLEKWGAFVLALPTGGTYADQKHCIAEAAAAEQAQTVRELKEGKGLENSNPEVQAAVDELLKRKAAVDKLKA